MIIFLNYYGGMVDEKLSDVTTICGDFFDSTDVTVSTTTVSLFKKILDNVWGLLLLVFVWNGWCFC